MAAERVNDLRAFRDFAAESPARSISNPPKRGSRHQPWT